MRAVTGVSRWILGRTGRAPQRTPRGQVLVLFAFMLTILIGMAAFVVDMAWIWSHQLQVQRAADAAALAGVVHLPGDEPAAITSAYDESRRNGYAHGVAGTTVNPRKNPSNDRQMVVDVSSPVETFFMRLFGVDQVTVSRTARAEYVLPVPMGSPENYYGVFGPVRTPGGGTTITTPGNTGWLNASATKGSNTWTSPGSVYVSDNTWATTTSTSQTQSWGNFGVSLPAGATVTGIEVGLEASWSGSGTSTDCRVRVDLSWNNGSSWTSGSGLKQTPALSSADPAAPYYVLGNSTDLWGRSSWSATNLSNGDFRVRVQARKPTCASAIVHQLDHLRLRVHYTTGTLIPDANLAGPNGEVLTPRGFWGTMLSQGAEDVNGDAYLPRYETRTSATNDEYLPLDFYDYAVEIPAGAVGGQIWIYDPVFCATQGGVNGGQFGTGDRWFGTESPMSAFYDVYNTQGTLHDLTDDTLVATSGNLFRRIQASDESLNGPGVGGSTVSCEAGATLLPTDGRFWHNRWWPVPGAQTLSGGAGGTIYRVRTSTTDPNFPSDQNSANGQNSWAIWTTATGGTPDVYGLGAMEAYTPLKAGQAATFYLSQIEAVHAGKTVRIRLWDPGDTQALPANMQVLIPNAGGYSAANISWTAEEGSTNIFANCAASSGSGTSILTNSGGAQRFNGCWITIDIPIPADYTAPQPPGEQEPGWWKINYVMGGSAGDNPAFDLTTWEVEIKGNPVHLVVP